MITGFWGVISAIVAIAITAVICAIAGAIIWKLFDGTIDLKYLIAEPADPEAQLAAQRLVTEGKQTPSQVPKASLSRLQFLIFTFVIAGVYLVLCLEAGQLVEIPDNVLLLLGISGTSYVVAKGIGTVGASDGSPATSTTGGSDEAGTPPPPPPPEPVG